MPSWARDRRYAEETQMDGTMRFPLARSEHLIVEELGDEILIYDSKTDKGHCLNPDAAHVWRRCDGKTPAAGLAAQTGLTPESVETALDELERCELLQEAEVLEEGAGHTRREMSVKVVKAGAAVAATPLIVSVLAPTPAMAATIRFCAQFSSGDCGNNGCTSTVGCCCCTPPVNVGNREPTPGSPCASFTTECKNCVPVQLQTTLCPQYGHGDMSSCSAGG